MKAKLKAGDTDIEVEGQPAELAELFEIMSGGLMYSPQSYNVEVPTNPQLERLNDLADLRANMPAIEKIKKVIKSKNNYRHTVDDLQKIFFKRTFKSRGHTTAVWHTFKSRVDKARRSIEQEEGVHFMRNNAKREEDGQSIYVYELEPKKLEVKRVRTVSDYLKPIDAPADALILEEEKNTEVR